VKFKILTFTKLREKSKIGEVFVGEIPSLFADLGFLPHMTSPISAFFPFPWTERGKKVDLTDSQWSTKQLEE